MRFINEIDRFVRYDDGVIEMERLVKDGVERVWILQHEEVYSIGGSGSDGDILGNNERVRVVRSNRGGKVTYHGAGQVVCYLVLDLRKRFGGDVHKYVLFLEGVIIDVLRFYGVEGFLKEGMTGVWVRFNDKDLKIGAIGVRVKRGFSMHGFSFNICCDLSRFSGIVPCGISEFGVTSLEVILGCKININDVAREIENNIKNKLAY